MSSMIPFDPYAALSQSPFGTSGNAPQWTPPAQPQPAPFTWGAGGSRLTPDQIAQKDKVAQALLAGGMDYSPVQSWTQGLARVSQGLMGGMQEHDLNKDRAANTAADQAIMASLMPGGGGGSAAALAAMTNPGASTGVRDAAKLVYQANNKAPAEAPEIIRLAIAANDPTQPQYVRDAAAGSIEARNNPVVTLPGGGLGLRSVVTAALGGGGQASGAAPGVSPPATLPPDFDFGSAPVSNMGIPANAVSPGGSTPTVLSRADAAPFMKSLGPQGFERWMVQHNIRLGN